MIWRTLSGANVSRFGTIRCKIRTLLGRGLVQREIFVDDLLVRIHFIIVMMRWTGLALWEFEFPFQGGLISTSLGPVQNQSIFGRGLDQTYLTSFPLSQALTS